MRGGGRARTDLPVGARLGAVAVALIVCAYTLALRRFGLDLVDEGTLVAQYEAVARGAVPYRDFQTGYGPLAFYANAILLRTLGADLLSVRAGLAVVHGVGAGLLYAIAARAVGARAAVVVPVVLWGCLRPVAPGAFAVFNVPYPAWYADVLGLVAVAVLLATRPRTLALVAVGALWGVAFLVKQNAGVFGLAGTVTFLALEEGGTGDRRVRWIGVLLGSAMVLGLGALATQSSPTVTDAVALAPPVVLLAVAVVRAAPGPSFLRHATCLAVGFAAIVGPVVGMLVALVGWETILRDTLQVGSGAAERFRVPYPTPAALITGPCRDATGWLAWGRATFDGLWLLALPIVATTGAALVAFGQVARRREWTALTCVGAFAYLQLFPRADQWHVLPACGLLVVLGIAFVRAVPGPIGRAALVGLVLLSTGRSLPTVPILARMATSEPGTGPSVPRAPIRWDVLDDERLSRIPDVLEALEGARSLFGFPALAFFNFATGVPSPVRHTYFFPGQPDATETARMLTRLRASPPDAAVVLEAPIAFFPAAFAAHPEIVAWLRSPAWSRTRVGPYEVARRMQP